MYCMCSVLWCSALPELPRALSLQWSSGAATNTGTVWAVFKGGAWGHEAWYAPGAVQVQVQVYCSVVSLLTAATDLAVNATAW